MLRYCSECRKDYDFSPLAVSGRGDLICPGCGKIIAKNSRHPVRDQSSGMEEGAGNIAAWAFFLSFHFFFLLSIAGTVCYFLNFLILLYVVTAVSLSVYVLQLFTGTLIFRSGLLLLPLGSLLGYLYFRSIPGACLGIHIVFLARHIIRNIIFRLIASLIRMSSGS